MHKSVENTKNTHTGATGSVTDDQAVYRDYRVRKTQSVLKQCINKQIAFTEKYVNLSKKFLKDPSAMELDQIEVLNIKCTQALAGDLSSSDKSDESDGENEVKNMQTLLSRKKEFKAKSKTQSSTPKLQAITKIGCQDQATCLFIHNSL